MTTLDTRLRSRRLMDRFASELVGAPVVLGMLLAGTLAVVGAVAAFGSGEITQSGWESAAQLARWYAGATGAYATAVYLPLYVVHGFTRREYAAWVPAYLAAFAVVFAMSMTLGYVVEGLVYRWFEWEHALRLTHLYATPDEYGLALLEFLLIGAIWSGVGAVLGAAFYRRSVLGALLVPIGIAMIGLVEGALGPGYAGPFTLGELPFADRLLGEESASTATALGTGCFAATMAVMWAVVRDMPIRTKSS